MTFSARYTETGAISAGVFDDGTSWDNITQSSRYYKQVMDLTNNGADILPWVPPGEPVPQSISDRQFFQELANMEIITQDEAIAAVATGTLPAKFVVAINALPAAQQFPAKMLVQGATVFNRDNPFVAYFAAFQGMSSEQVDDLWRNASEL